MGRIDMHLAAAVESALGTQTALGDRHDLIVVDQLQVQSASCGTRTRELSTADTICVLRYDRICLITLPLTSVRR